MITLQSDTKTFQGRPCVNGHPGIRYSRNKACVDCAREQSIKFRSRPGHKEWLAEYHRNRRSPETRAADRARHEKWRRSEKGKRQVISYWLKAQYGITVDEFEAMSAAQNNCCAICGKPGELERYGKLLVDHNHSANKVRELLCDDCNLGLGDFKDQPELLEKAAAYLRKHSKD